MIPRWGLYSTQIVFCLFEASVALSLQPDGTYRVQELGGTRRAAGRYAIGPDMLTFAAGQGDVGRPVGFRG